MITIKQQHAWDVSPAEAIAIQKHLSAQVIAHGEVSTPQLVAGIDVGFRQQGKLTRAAAVVLSFPELAEVESAVAEVPTTLPYIPGLLSFREVPAIVAALRKLTVLPDVLFCDGQGIIHPRRFGIACHVGVLTGLPSIGIGKSHFIGRFDPVPDGKGRWSPLLDGDERIGAVLRSREKVKPIYVSVGHRIDLERAIELTLKCLTRYRLPETTRRAHQLASKKDR